MVKGGQSADCGGQARQAEERQRGDDRSQREHLEQPRRAVTPRGPAAGLVRCDVRRRSPSHREAISPCIVAAEIVVGPAQVMPEVVRHVDPQGVAAQTDQGQEKLEDEDGCPHGGTDHKDGGHRYRRGTPAP